ncbi:MAG TPA: methionine--tRNA ligase subunit beta, partial [Bacteroidia bacterium]|nr:methionine--tRNA ligase subunit beta [Bacteroidia bacterium]
NPKRVQVVLNLSLQICANLSALMRPFLPFTSDKLSSLLNIAPLNWDAAGKADMLREGHQLGEPVMLFEKIEDDKIQKQVEKLHQSKTENQSPAGANPSVPPIHPQKSTIVFEDFEKMDIRVATIVAAVKVQGADKLLKLTVNTGIDVRTVVSGIAKYHSPEDIVGKQVCLLVNLAPRKLRGIESQGMILMAENSDGKLIFVAPTDINAENGGIVK